MSISLPSKHSLSSPASRQKLHALDLVEICSLIAQHLSKKDLTSCICVSKSWSEKFSPHYWRTVAILPYKTTRYSELTLSKYGSLVRDLSTGIVHETSVFNQPSISLLQRLHASTAGSKTSHDGGIGCLPDIIQRNKNSLLEFSWRCYGRDTLIGRPFRLWIKVFDGLSSLTDIELYNWALTKQDFIGILKSCPELRNLTLGAVEDTWDKNMDRLEVDLELDDEQLNDMEGHNGNLDIPFEEHDDDGNIKGNLSKMKKKKVLPPEFTHAKVESITFVGNFVPHFLQFVPNIQCLKLTALLNGDFQDLEYQTQRTQCLENLTHIYTMTKCEQPPQYLALVNAIPSPNHLVFFEGQIPARIARQFLEIIIDSHSKTIQHFVIPSSSQELAQDYSPLGFEFNIWRILESCPCLTQLQIPYFLGYASVFVATTIMPANSNDSGEGSSSDYTEITRRIYEPQKEWVCKDMTDLYLRIKDMDRMHPMDQLTFDLCVERLVPIEHRQKRSSHQKTLTLRTALEQMIFEKLLDLPKLRRLNIGSGWYDLPDWVH